MKAVWGSKIEWVFFVPNFLVVFPHSYLAESRWRDCNRKREICVIHTVMLEDTQLISLTQTAETFSSNIDSKLRDGIT